MLYDRGSGAEAKNAERKSVSRCARDMLIVIATAVACSVIYGSAIILILHKSKQEDISNHCSIDSNPADIRNASTLLGYRNFVRHEINASSLEAFMFEYSRLPHIAGGSRNTALAAKTYRLFQEFGFDDVRVQRLPALLMNLTRRSLNRTDPNTGEVLEVLNLDEVNVVNQSGWSDALPTSNGYSGSGKVNGPLVWANYGRKEDFEAIANVNLTGAIVVVRYGEIFRGDKVKYAQRRGAVGVVICLDAFDTGRGPGFPLGPWANNYTVQRGSITDNEGDPLTPTWPSEFGGPVIPLSDVFNETVMGEGMSLPTIPVQPISFGNAARLLQGLQGASLPDGWNATGFLSLLQSGIGPGPATASLEVERTLLTYNLTNVIATMYGEVEPDRTVILGAHRDAWTYGAADPISGHSIVLEVGRALGQLRHQTNWRPRRSVQLCSWDAEEWAIIGSNEYVETNIELLRQRAVAYLNLDVAVTGLEELDVDGSPLLQHAATSMAAEVVMPNGQPLSSILTSFEAVGSGSDHVGFIQLAGVPVLDCSIDNHTSTYESVYHSNYDDFYWMSKFGDPGFAYHKVMAEYQASLLLFLADSSTLPMHVEDYATKLAQWTNEYVSVPSNAFADFSFLQDSVALFRDAAERHAAKRTAIETSTPSNVSWAALREVNDISMGVERVFLGRGKEESGQSWYLHVIFTPSSEDAYAASTMPLIAEALLSGNRSKANFAIGRVAQFVRRAATFVNSSFTSPPWYANLSIPGY